MKKTTTIIYCIFLGILVMNLSPLQSVAQDPSSGTYYGFDYEYGHQSRNFTKSASFAHSFEEFESDTRSRTYTIQAPIRTGLIVQDVFWIRLTNRSRAAPCNEWELPGSPQNWRGYRGDGLLTNASGPGGVWYRYAGINLHRWNIGYQSLNISWFGRRIDIGLAERWILPTWKTNYTILSVVDTVDVPVKDWLGISYELTAINQYHIQYFDNRGTPADPNDDIVVFEELLIPRFVLARVITKRVSVDVSETSSTQASVSGQFNFTGTWEENLYGVHVSVKDSTNYWFDYFALISGNVVYEYEAGFTLAGRLSTNITRDVTFTENGSIVPESIRPAPLQSIQLVLDGEWDHYEEESGVLYGQGAIQSLVQVLLTKASTTENPSLAVWGNFNPGRVIGYKDLDGNQILTAYLNESYIATPDAIMAIGSPEGASLVGNYYARGSASAYVYSTFGDWLLADNEETVTGTVDRPFEFIWGFDPSEPNSGPSDVSLAFDDPKVEDDKAVFGWTTTYSDMPMTWWFKNETAEGIIVDNTDIEYGYILTIDPEAGEAVLESEYKQTEIGDNELKTLMSTQEMSMATYRRDYFLSMSQISADASGSFARPESQFDLTLAGEDLFSQDFGGAKEQYYLNNDPTRTYISGTSVMNLLAAEGFSGEPSNMSERNVYSSPISKRIATALTQWSADTHTAGISWLFRENIVITSYPTWGGEDITHDPSYSAIYSGTGEHTLEDGTNTDGVPGFELGLSFSLLAVLTIISRQKRRK